LFYSDGRNLYGDPGSTTRSNAGWIALEQSRVVIPAGETVRVQYRGQVPDTPTLRGTYWSLIMIESENTPAPAQQDGPKPQLGVRTLIRYAVQIAIDIRKTGAGKLSVVDRRLAAKDGKVNLVLDVENVGDRKITPGLTLELYDEAGKSVGKFSGGKWRIYPTCSVRFTVDLSHVRPGKYTALVIMDSGEDSVVGAQYALEINP
jgi:hypothetical protein